MFDGGRSVAAALGIVTPSRTRGRAISGAVAGVLDAVSYLGVRPFRATARTTRRLMAFGLIVLATTLTKFARSRAVVHPLIWGQIRRAGVGLLPFVGVLSVMTGFVLIGQTAALLGQVGAAKLLGPVLVVGLFRELAPLATALLVLMRIGTATVVELATMRATGEVEALEALNIDPIHFLVMPRVLGLALSVFCLTVYFLIGSLLSGYFFCFVQQLPLTPTEYLDQIAQALEWQDLLLLVLKTIGFGAAMAVITCYQGLARPLGLEQVPEATTRAVTHTVMACVVLDMSFLALYLLL